MKSIVLFTLLLASCKHLPELTEKDTLGVSFCTEIAGDTSCAYQWKFPPPATGYQTLPDPMVSAHFSCPSVNPNNPNQFVCFKQDFNWPPKVSFIIYDASTETEQVLFNFDGVMIGNLSWGKKDWIAYTSGPGTIRIFKSDGSNDHQIVASSRMNFGPGAGPAWSPDGNHLYYYNINPRGGIVCDTIGNIVSNKKIITMPSWNDNNFIIGGGGVVINLLALNSDTLKTIAEWTMQNEYEQIQSIEWLPDNRHAVFSRHRGLYRIDSQTGEILLMKDWCEMKNYAMLSVSNKGNFILCEKVISRHPSSSKAYYRHEIWKMDINGCNEVRVLPKE